jgi:lipoprotein-anchoring transpeptidase ErfK/SrfK
MGPRNHTPLAVKRSAAALAAMTILCASVCWGKGAPQTIWKPVARRRILVSIPDRKLAIIEHRKVLRIFRVAVGAPVSPTPSGTFEIVNLVSEPTYFHSGAVIPPSADNPVGSRWIGLNQKGYGIHGTNEPKSIGNAASHGCIRLRNHDVEQLFEMVHVQDRVEIRSDRDEEVAAVFQNEATPATQLSIHEAGGQ